MSSHTLLSNLPLDIWSIIISHMGRREDGPRNFACLLLAGLLRTKGEDRLNTFWALLPPPAPEHSTEPMFDTFPNVEEYKNAYTTLCDMGFNQETAQRLVTEAMGHLDIIFFRLGWL